jgi:hypothetical protein
MPQNFEGDQDKWDRMPQEKQDHITQSILHLAGHGPKPAPYAGPSEDPEMGEMPTESELATQRMRELPTADPIAPKPPVPPQEEISGAGGGGKPLKGGGGKGRAPTGGTPAAIGAQATKPPEPSGSF